MEKEQRKRIEMIPYLQDAMEETFQRTCREIQTVLDTDACRIWRGFHDAVCECLETAGALQRQNQKGRLGYLAFSMMRHALWLDRLELRIDALDDGFYMDTAEAAAHYHADFLQDRFRKDLASLYEKARTHFVRIQDNDVSFDKLLCGTQLEIEEVYAYKEGAYITGSYWQAHWEDR